MTNVNPPHIPSRDASELPPGLCCPVCRGELEWSSSTGVCRRCGARAALEGKRIPVFLESGTFRTPGILDWPDSFVSLLEQHLSAVRAGGPLPAPVLAEMQARGLLDPQAHLTRLATRLAYHYDEYRRQVADPDLRPLCERLVPAGCSPKVLDVGCGAGQTLRQLQFGQPCERVGIDIDLESLCLGCRLADLEQQRIWFVQGTATSLPFRDGYFTHVLSRVALNYVPQTQALREMGRVLRPGGYLVCRVEGPGFDLGRLARARGVRQLLSRGYDFLLGTAMALGSWQARTGSGMGGTRAFLTARRLKAVLKGAGCEMIRLAVLSRRLGLPVAMEFVARRRG